MDKLTTQSADLVQDHVEKIGELFPHVITEVRDESGQLKKAVDFELLKQELSDSIAEGDQERYQLTWPGKKEAILRANTPTDKTFRPVQEDSVNWDRTQNVYIEGDNLEVLKLLQEAYLNKVACIYIDPPYNTGKDFIYRDDFKAETGAYLAESGQVDQEGNRLFQNSEFNGRFHSDWLTMMYARLKLARNLLKEDGVIIVHIDEHETANLQKVLDEIFGAHNNLGEIVWDKGNPKGDATGVASQHEYILAYAKNAKIFTANNPLVRPKKNAQKILKKAKELYAEIGRTKLPRDLSRVVKKYGLSEEPFKSWKYTVTLDTVNQEFAQWVKSQGFSGGEAAYANIDENGDVYRPVSMAWPNKKKAPDEYFRPLIHPVTKKPCPIPSRGWRYPVKTMQTLLKKGLILFGKDHTVQPTRKYLLKENMNENVPSVIYFAGSDDDFFKEIGLNFDNPKPHELCKELLQSFVHDKDGLVLDFFSGSATTAHAVMQLNAEDGGNRKYIMVQLPEATPENSQAYRAGYKTICEIGKERIRRTARKIKEETGADIDGGFRVFRVDSSNVKDVGGSLDKLEQRQLAMFETNIKEDRTGEDLLIQVMLECGLELSLPVETKIVEGATVHFVAGDTLVACFDEDVPEGVVKAIAEAQPRKVVFRDSSFVHDAARMNAEETFKQLSPHTEVNVM